MKTILVAFALFLATSSAYAQVNEWRDLEQVHTKVLQLLKDMERARFDKRYDKQGHGTTAEQLLRDAEKELGAAVEAIKKK